MSIREGARFMVSVEVTQRLADWAPANLANPYSVLNVPVALIVELRSFECASARPRQVDRVREATRTKQLPGAPAQMDLFGPSDDDVRKQHVRELRQFEADRRPGTASCCGCTGAGQRA